MTDPAPTLTEKPTARQCAAAAKHLYQDAARLPRLLMSYRPYICPFEVIIPLVPAGARVLDVGCGGGLMLALLASAGRVERGLGFDTNRAMVGLASRVAGRHGLPLDFEARSVEQGIPAGAFDVISLIDVMHHIPPGAQGGFFRELIAHLPPGGRLIYKDMCRRPAWRALANRAHDLALARQWVHYFPIEQAESIALEGGLVEHTRSDANRWWYGHELRVYDRPA